MLHGNYLTQTHAARKSHGYVSNAGGVGESRDGRRTQMDGMKPK